MRCVRCEWPCELLRSGRWTAVAADGSVGALLRRGRRGCDPLGEQAELGLEVVELAGSKPMAPIISAEIANALSAGRGRRR